MVSPDRQLGRTGAREWCERVRRKQPACRFFGPNDRRNPMIGWFTVAGPDGETGVSHDDMEHAALCFLAFVLDDKTAHEALRQRGR